MKKKVFSMLVLLVAVVTGAWAQGSDPDPIELTSTDNLTWTLASMPDYDVELEVEYETELALSEATDNSAALTEWNGYEADVTLTRTLQTGGWNTFCVPFSITAANYSTLQSILTAQGGSITVKELSSSSFNSSTGALTLYFANADKIDAGKPYLVKVSNNLNLATLPTTIDDYIQANNLTIANPFKGVMISKDPVTVTTACANFVPVFSPTNLEGGNTNILFVTGGTALTYPAADGNINGFRAYFLLHDLTASARAYTLSFDDGETTGIQTLDNLTIPPMGNSVHDLQGRRIEGQPTQKGVYIVNGKITVIK